MPAQHELADAAMHSAARLLRIMDDNGGRVHHPRIAFFVDSADRERLSNMVAALLGLSYTFIQDAARARGMTVSKLLDAITQTIVDMPDPDEEITMLASGPLHHHPRAACQGEHCCLHNPSDHPLKDAPLNWRPDRALMERVCTHGIGHPDPDDQAHYGRTHSEVDVAARAVHGCCGCCLSS